MHAPPSATTAHTTTADSDQHTSRGQPPQSAHTLQAAQRPGSSSSNSSVYSVDEYEPSFAPDVPDAQASVATIAETVPDCVNVNKGVKEGVNRSENGGGVNVAGWAAAAAENAVGLSREGSGDGCDGTAAEPRREGSAHIAHNTMGAQHPLGAGKTDAYKHADACERSAAAVPTGAGLSVARAASAKSAAGAAAALVYPVPPLSTPAAVPVFSPAPVFSSAPAQPAAALTMMGAVNEDQVRKTVLREVLAVMLGPQAGHKLDNYQLNMQVCVVCVYLCVCVLREVLAVMLGPQAGHKLDNNQLNMQVRVRVLCV